MCLCAAGPPRPGMMPAPHMGGPPMMPMMGPPPPGMMPVGPGEWQRGCVKRGAAGPGSGEGRVCVLSRERCGGDAGVTARWLGTSCPRSADGQPHGPSWGGVSVRGHYRHASSSFVLCEAGHKTALQLLIQLLYSLLRVTSPSLQLLWGIVAFLHLVVAVRYLIVWQLCVGCAYAFAQGVHFSAK